MKKIQSLEGKIENVILADLNVDESYQRPVKAHHKKIAQAFDRAAAGVLHVGRRADAGLWLIDGRQRREAMIATGKTMWRAIVIHSDGPKHEARIYQLLNGRDSRKGLSAQELFRACVMAEDPVALATKRAVEACGLRIKMNHGGSRGWPEVACTGALYRETARLGENVTVAALSDMVKAWPQMDDCMTDIIPISMIKLYGQVMERIDRDNMVAKLTLVPPRKIILDSAVATGNRFAKCQEILLSIYNRKLPGKSRVHLKLVRDEEVA